MEEVASSQQGITADTDGDGTADQTLTADFYDENMVLNPCCIDHIHADLQNSYRDDPKEPASGGIDIDPGADIDH